MLRTPTQPQEHNEKKQDLPIHLVAENGRADLVSLLVQAAPDTLYCPDGNGNLPIHRAAEFAFCDCVYIMAKEASDTLSIRSLGRDQDRHGLPLFVLMKRGAFQNVRFPDQRESFEFLLSRTPLDSEDPQGSILHIALRHALPIEFMRLLVAKLAQDQHLLAALLCQQDERGNTPLHFAGRVPVMCAEEVMKVCPHALLRRVLQIRTTCGNQNTPLHNALRCPLAESSKILVNACNESLSIRNGSHLLPIQMVQINKQTMIPHLVEQTRVFDVDTVAAIASSLSAPYEDVLYVDTCYQYLSRFPAEAFEPYSRGTDDWPGPSKTRQPAAGGVLSFSRYWFYPKKKPTVQRAC